MAGRVAESWAEFEGRERLMRADRPKRTIHTYDSTISAGTDSADYDFFRQGKDGDWESYRAALSLLRDMGYALHRDPFMDRFKFKASNKHAGSKGDVHFHSEVNPAGFKFEFYEDVVRDNKYGGRHHFDKMLKMPYLRRLKVTLAHRKIQALLESRGFVMTTLPKPATAMEAIERRRAETRESHPYLVAEKQPDYNVMDEDKVRLKDADVRYFWSPNGRLRRGRCYYNMNSMWWCAYSPTEWMNEAAWRYFSYDPKKHGRKLSIDPIVKISRALRAAVEKNDYERARVIRDALVRMTPLHDLKPGDRVMVNHPNYDGRGIVDWIRPPFTVGVRVGPEGDGNCHVYEWATVKPVVEALEVAR